MYGKEDFISKQNLRSDHSKYICACIQTTIWAKHGIKKGKKSYIWAQFIYLLNIGGRNIKPRNFNIPYVILYRSFTTLQYVTEKEKATLNVTAIHLLCRNSERTIPRQSDFTLIFYLIPAIQGNTRTLTKILSEIQTRGHKLRFCRSNVWTNTRDSNTWKSMKITFTSFFNLCLTLKSNSSELRDRKPVN